MGPVVRTASSRRRAAAMASGVRLLLPMLLCGLPLAAAADGEPGPRLRGAASPELIHKREAFRASDGADIGYVVVSRQHHPAVAEAATNSTTVLIAPGLSGTAAGFADWFAPALLGSDSGVGQVVAMDWRGYGLSVGPWTPVAPPDGPAAPSYGGISTWRLAQDLHELARRICYGKLVVMGHSMGVNVLLQLLALHGKHSVSGLVLLDQSPKNMDLSGGVVVDPTFPSTVVTFTPERLQQWLPRYLAFDASIDIAADFGILNLTELQEQPQPYHQLDAALLDQFHAADEDQTGNASLTGKYMTQTTDSLLAWMRYLGASNGKVMALLMQSSMEQDMTGVASQVREAGLPFLWYSGEHSLVNSETIVWSARNMAPCHDAPNRTSDLGFGTLTSFCSGPQTRSMFELLQFQGSAGTHCPWLNVDDSAKIFMDAVTSFISRV